MSSEDERHVAAFLEMMAAERGAAANTLDAYRRDLSDYLAFLERAGIDVAGARKADVSRYMTLVPGDIITTGTPPGVALGMKPPQWLKAGDVVALGIAGLGEQRQRVVPFKGRRAAA